MKSLAGVSGWFMAKLKSRERSAIRRTSSTPPKVIAMSQGGVDRCSQAGTPTALAVAGGRTPARTDAGLSGDFKAAKIGFERALAVDPADAKGQYYFGETLVSLNEPAIAKEHFALARELSPSTEEGLKAEARLTELQASAASTESKSTWVNLGGNGAKSQFHQILGSPKGW